MTLRIAVPDGPLRAPSLELFAAAGVPAAQVTTLAAADVPLYLLQGAADVGLVAKDVLLERATGLCELLDLRFGGAALVYAAAPGATVRARRLGRIRVATRHPTLTRAYLAARGVTVTVVEVAGPLERAVADGLADAVVALVDDVPPVVAGLTVEGVVATTSMRLACGRGARVLHAAALGPLVARLRELTAAKESG